MVFIEADHVFPVTLSQSLGEDKAVNICDDLACGLEDLILFIEMNSSAGTDEKTRSGEIE